MTTALFAGTAVSLGASSAFAADPHFTFDYIHDGKNSTVAVYSNGHYAGGAFWNANPVSGAPGDAIQAVDAYADGWGVDAILESPYRLATTSGHSSPYISPWKTGNLTEGTTVHIRACAEKGLDAYCSDYIAATA